MQCGMTCLKMICNYYGQPYTLDQIADLCHATSEGVSMLALIDAAHEMGFQAEAAKLTVGRLTDMTLPCILHWNQNHFVVLYKVKGERLFYIADPAKGKTVFTIDQFMHHWTVSENNALHYGDGQAGKGIALLLTPQQSFYQVDLPKEKRWRWANMLITYFLKYRKQLMNIVCALFIGSLIQIILPFLTQMIVDKGVLQKDIHIVWLILIGQLMLTMSRTVADFWHRSLLLKVGMQMNIALINDFFLKLLHLPMHFFDTKMTGDIMQRIADHDRVNTFLVRHIMDSLFATITIATLGAVLCWYSLSIFLIFLGGSIAYTGWLLLFLPKRRVFDFELFSLQAENNNKTYGMVTTMQEIKLQQCQQRRTKEWQQVQGKLLEAKRQKLRLDQCQEAGAFLINETKNIVITVWAATSVINGNLTLGMMLSIQYIIGQLSSPVSQLMDCIYAIQDVKLSLERINDIHEKKDEDNAPHLQADYNRNSGQPQKYMSMTNVNFRYDPHGPRWILRDLSLVIPEGKVTAIVGESGSGKTTLLKLLLKYYEVQGCYGNGTICLGTSNLQRYNTRWWHSRCGVVLQDGVIFSESIERNIAVGDAPVNKNKLHKAAEIACCDEFIEALPLGYLTKIGHDGMGLSAGQRQRILIARAVYKDPDFIFLDEATNALDAKTERKITERLEHFYKGKTVIIIAHRLSTVRKADQIVVIEHGHVVEYGTHQELTSMHGKYYELVRNQLELGT